MDNCRGPVVHRQYAGRWVHCKDCEASCPAMTPPSPTRAEFGLLSSDFVGFPVCQWVLLPKIVILDVFRVAAVVI